MTEKEIKKNEETNPLGYVFMTIVIISVIIYFVMKLKNIKGEEFKPWQWPFSFWSGFYLWDNTQYILNPKLLMKLVLIFIVCLVLFSLILATSCWFYDRVLDYPQSESGEEGETKGGKRWWLIYKKLFMHCLFFVFVVFFFFIVMKPGSESWSILLTIFFILSSLGIAFQKETVVSWFVALTASIVSFFVFMPASY